MCDNTLNGEWFKFSGPAGDKLAESCVPCGRCGGNATLSLKGSHPNLKEKGKKKIRLCISSSDSCCRKEIETHVLRCGSTYYYKLKEVSSEYCRSFSPRYCGNGVGGK